MVFNGKRMKWQKHWENMPKTGTIGGHHSTGYPLGLWRGPETHTTHLYFYILQYVADTLCGLLSFNKSASATQQKIQDDSK